MGQIRQRDAAAAMQVLGAIASGSPDVRAFALRTLAETPRLVASELTTLSFCDLDSGRRTVLSDLPNAISVDDAACFNRHFHEHPLVRYHSTHPDGGSQRISDALAPSEFRHSALFNDYYRRLGIDSVIAVPLYVDQALLISLVLNRSRRDFSDRDRALLDLLRRPLAALLRNALALAQADAALAELRSALESEGWGAMSINHRRELLSVSPRARELLARWWPRQRLAPGALLPEVVDAWLRCRLHESTGIVGRQAFGPLALVRASHRLSLRACHDPDSPHGFLLLIHESATMPSPDQFKGGTLTDRESEVLTWVAAGKTNADIAAILGASTRTIEKHLEHAFSKLGVETRTAAAMRMLELCQERAAQRVG